MGSACPAGAGQRPPLTVVSRARAGACRLCNCSGETRGPLKPRARLRRPLVLLPHHWHWVRRGLVLLRRRRSRGMRRGTYHDHSCRSNPCLNGPLQLGRPFARCASFGPADCRMRLTVTGVGGTLTRWRDRGASGPAWRGMYLRRLFRDFQSGPWPARGHTTQIEAWRSAELAPAIPRSCWRCLY